MTIPDHVVEEFRNAQRVAVLTGAGVSAESGVPTFREAQTGLWSAYDPQELATSRAFRQDPERVWKWYSWRRQLLAKARPNPGHYALAALGGLFPHFALITQNIDGLHQAAGSDPVIELHGNIRRSKCIEHGHQALSWDEEASIPPRCSLCNSMLRPDVVWFGEMLPSVALHQAFQAASECDIFLAIGTSALVHPAAMLPQQAHRRGAYLIELNVESTPLSSLADCVLSGQSGELLPALVRAIAPSG